MNATSHSLSADQLAVVAAADLHIASGIEKPFVLHGLAGTGKTVTLAAIAKKHQCRMAAPTAKAAAVLSTKTGERVTTIHSLLYEFAGESLDGCGRRSPIFEIKAQPGSFASRVVIIDEASMVGAQLGRDLANNGAMIIAAGDPGQLRPVRDEPFFQHVDFTLKTIHRQAAESPIVRQAHRVRVGQRYEADGGAFRVVDAISDEDLAQADIVLCFRNTTRQAINARVRRLLGYSGNPQVGEPVLALRNAHQRQVFNGETYRLRAPIEPGPLPVLLRSASGTNIAVDASFPGIRRPLDAPAAVTDLEYGYALTVHKAQGSEWPSVVLIDEYPPGPDRDRWIYTGLTRASQRIVVGRRLAR